MLDLHIDKPLTRVEPVRTTDRGEVNEPVWEHADPFGRHATLVSEARKSRPVAGEAGMCCFDFPEHPDVINSRDSIACDPTLYDGDVWVAKNKAYFNPIDHEIIFRAGEGNHICAMDQIRPDDIEYLWEALHRRVRDHFACLPGVNQVNAGCNLGGCAGASQE